MLTQSFAGPINSFPFVRRHGKFCQRNILQKQCTHTARVQRQVTTATAGKEGSAWSLGRVASQARSSSHVCPAAATAPVPVVRPVPRSLSEIDNGKILGFGADLAKDHPVSDPRRCFNECISLYVNHHPTYTFHFFVLQGYGDEQYKQRRVSIAELARGHQV